MHTFLGVPILLRGVAYGNLYLTEKECGEDFTAEDEELVMLLAAQAAVAIENVRLYRGRNRVVLASRVAERGRERPCDGDRPRHAPRPGGEAARELHDATGQALASILMGLRSLKGQPDPGVAHEAITRLHDLTLTTLRDVRQLAVDLHPKPLDDFGLVAAVERLSYGPPRDQGRARELRARQRVAGMSMRGIPTPRFRALPEAGAGGGSDTGGMKVSYGVRWRTLGPRRAGRLSVGDRSLHLVALDVDGVEERELPFEEILEIDFCRPDRVLTVLLRSGEKIEMQTTVDRWIFDELAGKVTIAGAPSGQHEWHPGLGL